MSKKAAEDLKVEDKILWAPSDTGEATVIMVDLYPERVETQIQFNGNKTEWLSWNRCWPVWISR